MENGNSITKADLLAALTASRAETKADLTAALAEFKVEIKADLASHRTEMKADLSYLRTELKADLAAQKDDLIEFTRQIESNLLTEYHRYGKGQQIRLSSLESRDSG